MLDKGRKLRQNDENKNGIDSESNVANNHQNVDMPTKWELFHLKALNEIKELSKEPNENPELKYNIIKKIDCSIRNRIPFKYTYYYFWILKMIEIEY